MVIWKFFTVILFLCNSTFATIKTDNDLRGIFTSMDFLNNGLSHLDANALSCRYSKLLSILKDNFSLDEAENEATSFDNVKVKKNHGAQKTNSLRKSDSFEDENQDATMRFEDDNKNVHFVNTYDDFDFLKKTKTKKGTNSPIIGCDCKIKNDLLDLGHLHYPRYLLNAVCQKDDETFDYPPKCWRGAQCKPLEYKVRVLTYRSHNDHLQKDPTMSLLPDVLRSFWKFKTVTVAAGCFCS